MFYIKSSIVLLVLSFCLPSYILSQKVKVSLFQRGVISTSKNEFNPTLTADGKTLYIVHSLPGFKESKIMVSQFVKDKWTIPEPVSFSDTRYRDSDPCITPDGKILFFISNRPTDGSETAKVDYDIWKAELINGNWSKLIPIKEVNSSQMELGVEYSNGILYFNSTRGGQATSSDIYYSILENGVFSEPINIGAPINTSKFEADPVISTDGNYLVYSAWDRTEGRGQGDLYVSKKTEDGWSEAVNLGDEINSSAFEFTPFFSYDGKYLFFTSDIQDKTSSKKDKEILNGQFNVYRVSVKKLFKSLSLI